MTFSYKSGNGDVIDFCDGSHYFADPDSLRRYEWSYLVANGSVSRFSRSSASIPLTISISAETPQQGSDLLEKMISAFDYDVMTNVPGVIDIDGYESNAYVVSGEMSLSETYGLYEIETSVKVLLERPSWVREELFMFHPNSPEGGLNFPFNFPFNLAVNAREEFCNPAQYDSDIRIIVYGPATNPEVIIGNNAYAVGVDVASGGRLVIDGRDRTKINLYDKYGNAENVFHSRTRGMQGSGSYIFEKVKPGQNRVEWDKSFSFDLIVYDERSIAPCST